MSLRWKFALLAGALAAAAALVASSIGYLAVRDQLMSQVDESLAQRAYRLARVLGDTNDGRRPPRGNDLPPAIYPGPPPIRDDDRDDRDEPGDRLFLTQTVAVDGNVNAVSGVELPVDDDDREIAATPVPGPPRFRDAELPGDDGAVRLVTVPIPGVGAAQVARGISEMDETLSLLRVRLLLITVAVISLSALIGLLLSRRVTASLEQLTDSAEQVATSGLPDAEITVDGNDEIGRLGRALSQMLASLSRSREQQQRLVQDAGHELRTPLTSLKTNIAVLDRFERLGEDDRKALLADLRSETGEMAALVDELVELTVGGDEEAPKRVDLGRLARQAAERATRRSGREIIVRAGDVTVDGRPRSLERAISNLLDNAAKFDRSGGPIELTVEDGRVEVADRGPGIPEDQRELVFERFHRTLEARNVPGSGLGLSIVRDVATIHGGDAYAREREGGGAVVGFTFGAGPGGS